jgi:energy-coupling factor transport system ATP-binding protein
MKIEVESISFSYSPEAVALTDVSLHIDDGEFVAILGQNGAGKTTLAKQLNGLLRPDQGSVTVGDWRTDEHPPADLAARISYAFQNPDEQLFERTVWDEVAFGPRNLGLRGDELAARVEKALEQASLAERAQVHPYDLHASERKFVALAATLAMAAPILIIDEPTTGQDANGMRRLANMLDALRVQGKTVIVISHDIDFCVEHFQRGVLMANGRILSDGALTSVLQEPALLAQAAVEQPQLLRLSSGLGYDRVPASVDEFIGMLKADNANEGALM